MTQIELSEACSSSFLPMRCQVWPFSSKGREMTVFLGAHSDDLDLFVVPEELSPDHPRIRRLRKALNTLGIVDSEIMIERFSVNCPGCPKRSIRLTHLPTGWQVSSMIHHTATDNLILAAVYLYMAVSGMVGEFDERWGGLLQVRRK